VTKNSRMEQLLRCPPCRIILPPHQKYCHRAKKTHSFPFVLSSSPPPQQQLIRCYGSYLFFFYSVWILYIFILLLFYNLIFCRSVILLCKQIFYDWL
jgi:uncharacterized C2H2 Zn-finger protein